MINLTSSTSRLQVVTSATGTLDCLTSWVDLVGTTVTPGGTETKITAAGAYSIAGSPASGVRNVKKVTITNMNAASIAILVQCSPDSGTTTYQIRSITLAQNETLQYDDNVGWTVYDSTGAVRSTGSLGRFVGETKIVAPTTSFTTGSTTTKLRVRAVGSGGGGGGGAAAVVAGGAASGGGGSGGSFAEWIISVTPNTAYVVSAPAGGAGGAVGATGTNGTSTTITVGGTVYSCPGGIGGPSMGTAAATALNTAGGSGGSQASSGTILVHSTPGQSGGYASRASGTVCASGDGGASYFGMGGTALVAQGNGGAALGPGGGGAGGNTLNGGATTTGGAGGGGMLLIEEYS